MKRLLILFFVLVVVQFSFGGIEFGTYTKLGTTINSTLATNNIRVWSLDVGSPYGNFELNLQGAAASGINFWTIFKSSFNAGYVSGGYISSYLGAYDFASHIQFWQKWGESVFFLSESWRINMYQPLLQFASGVGTINSGGVYLRLPNLFGSGFEFKSTLVDYANELIEKSAQENKNESAITFRLSRYDMKDPILNNTIGLGVTGGFLLYQISRNTNDWNVYVEDSWRKGQYNVLGLDANYTGSIPGLSGFSFNISGEVGRSFAPESVSLPLPNGWTESDWALHRFLLGDNDALVYKFVTKLGYNSPKVIGGIEFTYSVVGLQPNYRQYLGGAVDPASGRSSDYFEQFVQLSYAFPVKFVNLKSYMKYVHNYDWETWVDSSGLEHNDYNIWQFLFQEKMLSKSASHYLEWITELYASFKGGVKFIGELQQYFGRDYLLQFDPEKWFRHLVLSLDFENEFAKIRPMVKFFNLQEPDKSFLGFGVESTVNLLSWVKFYSRLGVMRGYQERVSLSGNLSWTSFFGQLQIYPAGNTRILITYGNGGDMDTGLVGDVDFVRGAETANKINIEAEMYF
ncbi:MAG: hypothetical protein ACP5QP_04770 [Brevinematia bacterium]